jgi:hypothetical protein
MAGLTEALQIALVTEESFNVGVEIYKPYVWVNNRDTVVYLYLSGWEVRTTCGTHVVLCQSPSLHINLLLCLCRF